jgi:hypothetical protein
MMFQAVFIDATRSYFDTLPSPAAVSILNRKRVIYYSRVVQFFLCRCDETTDRVVRGKYGEDGIGTGLKSKVE